MNTDYRIDLSWRDSIKRKKLARRLGPEGVLALMDLWGATAEHRAEGVLAGWDQEDIEIQAGWAGQAGELVATLAELCLLDFDEKTNTYSIHDWVIWNPYAAAGEKRREIARKGAEARWAKERARKLLEIERQCSEHAQSMRGACSEHAGANAPSMQNDAPSIQNHANSNAPYQTIPNRTGPSHTPPTTPPNPNQTPEQKQNQVGVGGGNQDDQNQTLGDIEDLLRLLKKYQEEEKIDNPGKFFPWKLGQLLKKGLAERDRQDRERLLAKEAQEEAQEEEKKANQRRQEEADQKCKEETNRLYADFQALPVEEKKRIENITLARHHTAPGSPSWPGCVAATMRRRSRGRGEAKTPC